LVVALWILIALGVAEVGAVIAGSLFTRTTRLLPYLILGVADVAIPSVVLWAFKRAAR
jgi:hypothetical protein